LQLWWGQKPPLHESENQPAASALNAANRTAFHMFAEGVKSLLLRKLKLLNLKPFADRASFRMHRRRIAEADTGSSEIVFKFLPGLSKHAGHCMPFCLHLPQPPVARRQSA